MGTEPFWNKADDLAEPSLDELPQDANTKQTGIFCLWFILEKQ